MKIFTIKDIIAVSGNVCQSTWNVQCAYNPNSASAKTALDNSLAACAQYWNYSDDNYWNYINRLDLCVAVALAVHRPNYAYLVASSNCNSYNDLASTSVLTPHTAHNDNHKAATTVAATCTKQGSTTTPVTGHTAGEWEAITPATCTAEGTQVKKCTACGEILESKAIAALEHNYETEVTAPTCTEAGYTTYICLTWHS